jgi:hypothetical protein
MHIEGHTRYVMLLHLPSGHEAIAVQAAMGTTIKIMSADLFKALPRSTRRAPKADPLAPWGEAIADPIARRS